MSMTEKAFLSIREVCDRFGLDYKTIWRQIQAGELPASRVGRGAWRISADDLDAYISRRRPATGGVMPSSSQAQAALATDRITVFSADEERAIAQDRLTEARERLANGEINVLITALQAKQREMNTINRFDRKLRELASLRLPPALVSTLTSKAISPETSGLTLRITAPEKLITTSDEQDEMMNILNTGFLERNQLDRLPLNPREMLTIPAAQLTQPGAKTRPTHSLVIELRLWSDLRAHMLTGFAEQPLALEDLLPRLNAAARAAQDASVARILALASTTGWAEDAEDFIYSERDASESYTHHLLMPALVDLTRNTAVWDRRDSRLEPFMGLFTPTLRDERITAAMRAIEEKLWYYDELNLTELKGVTGAPEEIVQIALDRMVAGGRYKLGIIGNDKFIMPARE